MHHLAIFCPLLGLLFTQRIWSHWPTGSSDSFTNSAKLFEAFSILIGFSPKEIVDESNMQVYLYNMYILFGVLIMFILYIIKHNKCITCCIQFNLTNTYVYVCYIWDSCAFMYYLHRESRLMQHLSI